MMTKSAVSTVEDFGRQWGKYTANTGYYGSKESLLSLFGPLLTPSDIQGKRVADVGAGTGRYSRMLNELGAGEVLALEPSSAMDILRQNTASCQGMQYLQGTAEQIPPDAFDAIFCIGVLQFIPDPLPSLQAVGRALNREGKLFLWVYGEENNRLYLSFVRPIRHITSRLSHDLLDKLAGLLVFPASFYAGLCCFLPLPMAAYLRRYFSKLDYYSRKLVVYDQLNPKYARYYRKKELESLLKSGGFTDVRMYHHLGYSWSVTARYKGGLPD
jgi:ubiquinone/menaquinone biosynthesis C-methylase UbiE